MITSVRFPTPVAVIKGDMRVEWQPGERGVGAIQSYPSMLAFDVGGKVRWVYAPPGTVVETGESSSGIMPTCQQCGTTRGAHAAECPTVLLTGIRDVVDGMKPEDAIEHNPEPRRRMVMDEPAASEASDSPPPARPIPKSGRVRR